MFNVRTGDMVLNGSHFRNCAITSSKGRQHFPGASICQKRSSVSIFLVSERSGTRKDLVSAFFRCQKGAVPEKIRSISLASESPGTGKDLVSAFLLCQNGLLVLTFPLVLEGLVP